MGGIAIALEKTTTWFDTVPADPQVAAFFIGFVVGFAITAILLSVIASGVNAVIVMFADAPGELERNYPDHSSRMRTAWTGAFPGSV